MEAVIVFLMLALAAIPVVTIMLIRRRRRKDTERQLNSNVLKCCGGYGIHRRHCRINNWKQPLPPVYPGSRKSPKIAPADVAPAAAAAATPASDGLTPFLLGMAVSQMGHNHHPSPEPAAPVFEPGGGSFGGGGASGGWDSPSDSGSSSSSCDSSSSSSCDSGSSGGSSD